MFNNHHHVQLLQHYKEIGQEYDIYYQYIYKVYTNAILRHVPIGVDDNVLDIGGGTGELAHMIWKQAGLRNRVLCVEPSEDMLVVAREKEGVVTVKATAEEFFNSESSPKQMFDVVMMNASFHHFQDPVMVISGVKECLPKNGMGVITSHKSHLPIISMAKALLEKCTDHTDNTLDLVQSSGLKAEVKLVVQNYTIDKQFWYNFMRKRMYSFLRQFSDEEIEEGIDEMEKQYGDVSEIQMESKLQMIFIKHN